MYQVFDKKENIPEGVAVLCSVQAGKEAAEEILALAAKQVAVPFYGSIDDSDEIASAEAKIRDMEDKLAKFIEEKSVRNFQAKNITCRSCESSLAKSFLKNDICPVCGADLRIQTVIDSENQQRQKIADAKAALAKQRIVHRMFNGSVLWLSNCAEDIPCPEEAPEGPETVVDGSALE